MSSATPCQCFSQERNVINPCMQSSKLKGRKIARVGSSLFKGLLHSRGNDMHTEHSRLITAPVRKVRKIAWVGSSLFKGLYNYCSQLGEMTCTLNAAGWSMLQLGRKMLSGLASECGMKFGVSFDGAKAAHWSALNITFRMALCRWKCGHRFHHNIMVTWPLLTEQ